MNCPLHVGTQMVPMPDKHRKRLAGRWKGRGRTILVSAAQVHHNDIYDREDQVGERLRCPIEGCMRVSVA